METLVLIATFFGGLMVGVLLTIIWLLATVRYGVKHKFIEQVGRDMVWHKPS